MSSTQGARKFPANISFTNTLTPKAWSQTPSATSSIVSNYETQLRTIIGSTTATLIFGTSGIGSIRVFPSDPVYTAPGSYITIVAPSNQAVRSDIIYTSGGASPSYMNTMQGILGIALQILGTTFTAANIAESLTFTLPFAAQESTTLVIAGYTGINYFGTTIPSAFFNVSNPIYVSPSTTVTWSFSTPPVGGLEFGYRKYVDIPIRSVVGSRINMNAYIPNSAYGSPDSLSTVPGTLTLSKAAWNLTSGGTRYVVGNNFRINGTYFGGTSPANDITISVTGVNSYGAITSFTVDGTMPIFPIYKPVILDFVDSANYVRDASEWTLTNREVNIYNENRSGTTILGRKDPEIVQGNQFRTSYLFGQLKSGAGFGGGFNTNGISYKPEQSNFTQGSIDGLYLWLDGADSSTLFSNTEGTTPATIGGTVARWNDKSGNGNHLTVAVGPTRSATPNNPVGADIMFNGTTQYIRSNSVTSPGTAALSVFILVRNSSSNSGGSGRIIAGITSGPEATDSTGFRMSNNSATSNSLTITKGSDGTTYNGITWDQYHIINSQWNGSAPSPVYSDGSFVSQYGANTASTFTFNRFGLGASLGTTATSFAPATFWAGSLNEVLIFSSVLTTTQRQQVEGYLATKWGLQGNLIPSHPYYIAPTPAAFVPTQFSGLTLWLDGADATTITGTSNVTQWRDKSTSLAHFNTVSGAPTYTSSTEGVVFNTDVMRTSISGTYTPGVSSLFVVTNVSGAGPGGYSYVFSVGTNSDTSVRYNINSPGSDGFGQLLDANSVYLNGRQINIGIPSGILNNKSVIDGTIATGITVTLMQLGTSFNNRGLVGSIQEILLYSTALTSGQRIQVEEYLKAKWGVVNLSPDTVPGLNLWLDAGDKSTLFTDAAGTVPVSFTSQSVALWKDKSKTGNNATLPTSTVTPYNTGAVAIYNDNNALPTLRFSGRNGYNLNGSLVPNGSAPATYFFVMNALAGINQEQTALITGTYGIGVGRRFHVNSGNFQADLVIQSVASDTNKPYNASQYRIGSVTMSTTSISGWNNGSPFSTNVSGNALNSGTGIAQIGYLAEFPLVGNISEMLIYNGQLTTAQRQYVEGYLATKWGTRSSLVAGHPYRIPTPNLVIPRPTFVPTSISGCALWLDAADAMTITRTGVNVSGWNDKSGNGVNMVYDTTTAGPLIYNSAGFNNSPSITFSTSASGRSALIRSSGINLSGTASLSIYTVLNPSTNSASFPRILSFFSGDDFSGGTLSGFNIGLTNATTTANIIIRRPPETFSYSVGSANTNVISSVIFNSNVSQNAAVPLNRTGISINGNAFETVSISGTNFLNYSSFRIGGGPNTTDIFSGNISEILIFRRALTLPEHQQIEGYLAWKWGLQTKLLTTHPYYISAPSGGTAFLPTMFNTGTPIMWLDASDRDAITLSGSSVTKWWDKSGKGNNLVNASGYQIPNYNISGMNGSPTVSFFRNNSGSFSVLENTAFSGLSGQASMTLMFVAQRNGSAVNYQRFISAAPTTGAYDSNVASGFNLNSRDGSQINYERNNGSTYTTFNTTANAFLGELIVNGTGSAVGNISGTTSYIYANGSQVTISGVSAGSNFFVSHLRLGSAARSAFNNDYNDSTLQGNISEMILFPRVLTTTEFQQLEGYLAWKWGIQTSLPANHPNLYSPPVASPITTPFSPLSVGNVALWLDALDPGTISFSSGSNVSQWNDKSGNGRNASPTTNAFQYVSAFNGSYPTLSSSITGGNGQIANIPSFTLLNPSTIFAVIQNRGVNSGDTFPYVFDITGAQRAYAYSYNQGGPGTPGRLRIGSGSPYPNADIETEINSTTAQVFTMGMGVNNTLSYTNGNLISTTTVPGASVNSGTLSIGGLVGGNMTRWTGYFCELIIVNASLTDVQRQLIEGYLAWKWNLVGSLPTNHLYFSAKP